MVVFSSLTKAVKAGFYWVEDRPELEIHVVARGFLRQDGKRHSALALARMSTDSERTADVQETPGADGLESGEGRFNSDGH